MYDAIDWKQHKATDRYFRHLQTMPRCEQAWLACAEKRGSYTHVQLRRSHAPSLTRSATTHAPRSSRTVRALVAPTGICFLQTLLVALYATFKPVDWPVLPMVSESFFDLTGGALALLLVFRTDAAYQRWDDSRECWGKLIIHGRSLVRRGLDAFTEAEEASKCALARWTVAFGVLLKLHLRADTGPDTLRACLADWLSADELAFLDAARHKPNAALQVLSGIARRAPPKDSEAMEEALSAFSETLGRCERISRVPIPLAYTRHTSRFLIAWLLLLPLGCWTWMGPEALLCAPLVAFLLLGVDQIGVDLENPFSVLPLEVLANKLKWDATDMMEQHATVRSLVDAAAAGRAQPWLEEAQAVSR